MLFLNQVLEVENPHVTEIFKLFEVKGYEVDDSEHRAQLGTNALIYLDNMLGAAIDQSVDQHRKVERIDYDKLIELDVTDKIVYLCPIGLNYIVGNPTFQKAKHVVVTRRIQMDDRVAVLTPPADFDGPLADYSIDMVPLVELEPDVKAALKMSILFHVESVDATLYICDFQE